MSLVGFKAKNHKQQVAARGADDGVDERITPDEIYLPLHAEHGFTLDVAANARNTKCEKFFSLSDNGVIQSWDDEVVWCNPPYSNCAEWVAHAHSQVFVHQCRKVVMLLPANRTEQKWWQIFIEPYRESGEVKVRFLSGRRRFGWPEGRVVPKKGDRPPFGLCVVIFERTNP